MSPSAAILWTSPSTTTPAGSDPSQHHEPHRAAWPGDGVRANSERADPGDPLSARRARRRSMATARPVYHASDRRLHNVGPNARKVLMSSICACRGWDPAVVIAGAPTGPRAAGSTRGCCHRADLSGPTTVCHQTAGTAGEHGTVLPVQPGRRTSPSSSEDAGVTGASCVRV